MVEATSKTDSTTSENVQLRNENDALREELQSVKQQLAWLQRQVFGRKSEKRLIDQDARSGLLFNALPESESPTPTEQVSYTRRKGAKERGDAVTDSGLRFNEDVPVEVIHVADPEAESIPREHREVIDEKVTHRLAQRPGSYVVLEYRRAVVKDKRSDHIHTAPTPANVLEGSLADVSFLAGLLIDKFCYHLPLYRQHQRLAMSGITVSRNTLTQLVERAIRLLKPVYDAQLEHILRSKVLAMDETPIKAGRGKPGKMKQGWFWPVYGEDDEVCFIFSDSRGSKVVTQALGEHFDGTLVTDGHSAYTKYVDQRPAVTHANCWAHARRKFEAALKAEPKAANEALELIGQLYQIERQIRQKDLHGDKKLTWRAEHSLPVVKAFWAWCDQQRQRMDLARSSPLLKALGYVAGRQAALQVFLSDPDVPIDTNHLERALRPIPMGRKNWLFSWSELGARHIGVIQSLLVTCRLHEVDPYTYLVDVLQRVNEHPASRVGELVPQVWKDTFAGEPLVSDLQRVSR
ncbi:IS66 family transposase [Wenzhouxiangella sp. AB-CW3]|uniref:IS66 family transposase n=1 Tax=Wenzhouxiangella sp. AB-CW3 TaxID=2771012 RepID=UPI00168BA956|nr:IS66 family transposase [Wenzhouxiangella sp. AB-CW3]QOC23508.1 IS66 family transposase [Wenzhouxiangella sp. AB-CW3]QOC23513.1 IS66 family transposase [Wenzhouxiangella sp. AB-CW3]